MIDLHSHTTASDGQYTADELFNLARASGVTTLAVTDHDTVEGLEACQNAAHRTGLRLVPGIEISTRLNRREVHILGHFIDAQEPGIAAFSTHLKVERARRMEAMVGKMQALGFPVTMEQVLALAGPGHLARPHLARVLVELNYCSSTKEAFDRFLADDRPAAVPRLEVTVPEAIDLIHRAGGTATVAHPGVSRVNDLELQEMRSWGLDGVEVEHSDHPPSLKEKLAGLAAKLGLVVTGGSDFHGEKVAPNRNLGRIGMTAAQLAELEARAATHRHTAATAK
jgi:hypothetical protein